MVDPDQAREQLALELSRLQRPDHAEHRAREVVPWVISAAIHVGLILLGFLVTWTVVRMQAEEEPVMIVAEFYPTEFEPVTRLDLPRVDQTELPRQNEMDAESIREMIDLQMSKLDERTLDLFSDASSQSSSAQFAPAVDPGAASFAGIRTTNARRIVYVIDASGSMIRSLPIVLDELARSLELLSSQQSFGIIFFQQNEALIVPPANRLSPARSAERQAAMRWIREKVIPRGRSNPLRAIEAALALKPDAIFLLSENITGSGEFEIDQRDLLALLDRLNPTDSDTGRRRTQINCIQFLDPDPLDTLRKIAAAHGGPNGYRFLSRGELGLDSR